MATIKTELIDLQPNVRIHTVVSHPTVLSEGRIKPTLVFLNFWGGSARTWSLVIPLIREKVRTVAIDFRGWGSSLGPDVADAYSVNILADDVEAVIAKLELTSVMLVGLSMGAKVAQLVAGRGKLGATLKGLVLVSPAPPTPLILPPEMREQQLRAYENPEAAAFVAANVLTATFHTRDLPDFVVSDMMRGSPWAKKAWPAYAMAEDISDAAEKIAIPALVLASEKDVVEPLDRVEKEVVSRISGVDVQIISLSGHLSPVDAPEAVAAHLVGFLSKVLG